MANALLAWCAAMTSFWAASHSPGMVRKLFVTIGTLALFYSFAYWWLVFDPTIVREWSNLLRPVGIVTWLIAWTIEPIVIVKQRHVDAREVEAIGHRKLVSLEDER